MTDCAALEGFLQGSSSGTARSLLERLHALTCREHAARITLYQQAIPLIEQSLWQNHADDAALKTCQAVFRELEAHIAAGGEDHRHHIILFIPVADRPLHLTDCLNSLLTLCELYQYGGVAQSRYKKITVLIGDDSRDKRSIEQHRAIVNRFNEKGLHTVYFGQAEQLRQLDKLSDDEWTRLPGVLGKTDPDAFYHKGSPCMRNIAHLKLREMAGHHDKVLFYSLDSDQEFQVKVNTGNGERDCYGLNYFYYLDRIFTQSDACILTGKVVGDPPVSPAVMAGNFLQDVSSLLQQMAGLDPHDDCRFHAKQRQETGDAAYHDMAEMFGFKRASGACHYPCPLPGRHANSACLDHFARRVNAFFHGEHLTRKTWYEYAGSSDRLTPARTVYPGNYVFNKEGLNYFIPFAPLKLRMNGPVMGRVVKALLKDRFVSANLPMLHKRTVHNTGQSEFRPDIHQQAMLIDLSGEFERQYFGDVMLFGMEKLTAQGYPTNTPGREAISRIVHETERHLQQQYLAKHREIMQKLQRFEALLNDKQQWWHGDRQHAGALARLQAFADNIRHNFGDTSFCYRLINSSEDKQARLAQIIHAIRRYPAEQQAWQAMMSPEPAGV